MTELVELFGQYGLPIVFGAVLVEQIGPPVPSGPLLIMVGAMAGSGQISLGMIAGVAWLACMLGNAVLYLIGGRFGRRAMRAVCRVSILPDVRVGRIDKHLERWGPSLLIVADFIPGVRTLAPSIAGAEKLPPASFLLYSGIGAALWTAFYLCVGLIFRDQVHWILGVLARSGRVAVAACAAAIAIYFIARWWRRRQSVKGAD